MIEIVAGGVKAWLAHVSASASIGVLFPVLLSSRSAGMPEKESAVTKVLIAVVIQAITATAAVTVGTLIATSVIEARIEALQEADNRIASEVYKHVNGGHPWTFNERVRAVEQRVDRLERGADKR